MSVKGGMSLLFLFTHCLLAKPSETAGLYGPSMPYSFAYNVYSPEYGDFHGHQQSQDAQGRTSGTYYLLAPDGYWHETTFSDSGSGYHAVTKKRSRQDVPELAKQDQTLAVYFNMGDKSSPLQDINIGIPVRPTGTVKPFSSYSPQAKRMAPKKIAKAPNPQASSQRESPRSIFSEGFQPSFNYPPVSFFKRSPAKVDLDSLSKQFQFPSTKDVINNIKKLEREASKAQPKKKPENPPKPESPEPKNIVTTTENILEGNSPSSSGADKSLAIKTDKVKSIPAFVPSPKQKQVEEVPSSVEGRPNREISSPVTEKDDQQSFNLQPLTENKKAPVNKLNIPNIPKQSPALIRKDIINIADLFPRLNIQTIPSSKKEASPEKDEGLPKEQPKDIKKLPREQDKEIREISREQPKDIRELPRQQVKDVRELSREQVKDIRELSREQAKDIRELPRQQVKDVRELSREQVKDIRELPRQQIKDIREFSRQQAKEIMVLSRQQAKELMALSRQQVKDVRELPRQQAQNIRELSREQAKELNPEPKKQVTKIKTIKQESEDFSKLKKKTQSGKIKGKTSQKTGDVSTISNTPQSLFIKESTLGKNQNSKNRTMIVRPPNFPNLPPINLEQFTKPNEVINKVNFIHLNSPIPNLQNNPNFANLPNLPILPNFNLPSVAPQFQPKPIVPNAPRIRLDPSHKIVQLLKKLVKERPDLVSTKPFHLQSNPPPVVPNSLLNNLKRQIVQNVPNNLDSDFTASIPRARYTLIPTLNQLNINRIKTPVISESQQKQQQQQQPKKIKVSSNKRLQKKTSKSARNFPDFHSEIPATLKNNFSNSKPKMPDVVSVVKQEEKKQKQKAKKESQLQKKFISNILDDKHRISFFPVDFPKKTPKGTKITRGNLDAVKIYKPMPFSDYNQLNSYGLFESSDPFILNDFPEAEPLTDSIFSESIHHPLTDDFGFNYINPRSIAKLAEPIKIVNLPSDIPTENPHQSNDEKTQIIKATYLKDSKFIFKNKTEKAKLPLRSITLALPPKNPEKESIQTLTRGEVLPDHETASINDTAVVKTNLFLALPPPS